MIDDINELESYFSLHFKHFINCNFKQNANSERLLSERQFQILYLIEEKKITGLTNIAKAIDKSKSSTSLIVSKLEKNEYLVKKSDKTTNDNRKVVLELTDEGKKILESERKEFYGLFDTAYNKVGKEVMEQILQIVSEINETVASSQNAYNNLESEHINPKDKYFDMFVEAYYYVSNFIHTVLSETYKQTGKVTLVEGKLLMTMYSLDDADLSTLSKCINTSTSTTCVHLSKLIKKELISQTSFIDDKRKCTYKITALGKEAVEESNKIRNENILDIIENSSEDTLKKSEEIITKMVELVKRVSLQGGEYEKK